MIAVKLDLSYCSRQYLHIVLFMVSRSCAIETKDGLIKIHVKATCPCCNNVPKQQISNEKSHDSKISTQNAFFPPPFSSSSWVPNGIAKKKKDTGFQKLYNVSGNQPALLCFLRIDSSRWWLMKWEAGNKIRSVSSLLMFVFIYCGHLNEQKYSQTGKTVSRCGCALDA